MMRISTAFGDAFLPLLPVDWACAILTFIPTAQTHFGTPNAVAAAIGFRLVAPKLTGLMTIDQVHLDPRRAQRWPAAFLEQAGPQVRNCLSERPELHVAMSAHTFSNGN